MSEPTRFCLHCKRQLPIASFKPGAYTRVCLEHVRRMRLQYSLGTLEKRAFNSLRLRARHDRFAFGHEHIRLSFDDALALLTPARVRDYRRWSLVPRHPERILDAKNAVLVTNYQRRYLMCQWRTDQCVESYKTHLAFLMSNPDHVPTPPRRD